VHKRLYVGNLPDAIDETALRALFSQYGEVNMVQMDAYCLKRHPRGVAIIEMATDVGARAAMENLNGFELQGRKLRVDETRSRPRCDRRAFGRRR